MSERERLTVATPSRTIFALPYWVAEQKGFFDAEGLAPTLDIINNVETIKAKIAAGIVQSSLDSPEGVIVDAYKGGRLRIIAGNARRPPLFVIAKPSIRTVADLRGATIGVLSLTEGSSRLLARITAAHGLQPYEYQVVAVGGAPTRWTLLQQGKIDAGLQPFPLSYQAEARGFNNLGWAGAYEPDWQFTVFSVDQAWAHAHRQTVVRFLRALLRGQQDIAADPAAAARIAADRMETSLQFAMRSIADLAKLDILDPMLNCSEAGLARVFETVQENGANPAHATFDIANVVAGEYLDGALRSA